ncbi:peptidyl-prolyl cis-trans isomerase CYP26-2, chloroplastic [Iris pallida]|uniref:Peptidyl-prolyl cis-trans isomerase CYP26-2, chloroplastic n=1 Tax=Iris pallida TaxID=29817 RepID=A0AAX6E924_IRIPA|nr:peptidyl-prolyl cis-trans isomerase CYP26-2, chloroplastic [Iris pallida]
MKPLLHSLPSPPQFLLPPPPPHLHLPIPTPSTLPRRSLTVALPLLLLPVAVPPLAVAKTIETNACTPAKPTTKTAFLDVAIDGQPVGRIAIGLYGDAAPVGASRFASLVSGAAGISYRRKEFVKIMPNYVQHAGVRSYGADAELAARGGGGDGAGAAAADALAAEWEAAAAGRDGCAKSVAGSVGIVVRDPAKPPPKTKIVAKKGRLEVEEEEVGKDPNGTEFVIVTKDSPELDDSVLVVGRVLEGMDVVERIGRVKTVQDNTASPYFRVAKLIGDKRAVVAERGFNRPYSKVIVTNCGLSD